MRKSFCSVVVALLLGVFFVSASYAEEWSWMAFQKGNEEKTGIYTENPKGAIVYKDKSLGSEVITTLPNGTEILVAEFHAKNKRNPDPRFKDMRTETWAKLISPVAGWVVADEVGAWYSDLLVSFGLFDQVE